MNTPLGIIFGLTLVTPPMMTAAPTPDTPVVHTLSAGKTRATAGYRVDCLNGPAADAAILDESLSPWFSLHTPAEYGALTRTAAPQNLNAPAASRKTFVEGRRDFTPAEKAAMESACERIRRLAGSPFTAITERPWRFIKLKRGLASDFPHTRGDCILFTEAYVETITAYEMMLARQPAENRQRIEVMWMRQVGEIFLHEQLHVMQRTRPALFEKLYATWGFERIAPVAPPADATTFAITNPDAPQADMAWRDATGERWIFGMRLRHRAPFAIMAQDMILLAWRLTETNGRPVPTGPATPVAQVPGFAQKFPVPEHGCDHPNEISAYLLGAILQPRLAGEPAPATGAAGELAAHLATIKL